MIKLQTPVQDIECRQGISYNDKILMLGSCFTDNIGKQLIDFGFDICLNPFGTLYNPVSILKSLERISTGEEFTGTDCEEMGSGSGLICSFSHHTSAARTDKEEFLKEANESLAQAHRFFQDSNCLIITLGTAWCYRHKDSGKTVSNCLKRDAREFERYSLSLEEATDTLAQIKGIAGKRKIIFTVSPIRHLKDGAHGNQLSKAILMLSIDRSIRNDSDGIDYFPAYEIMMDELRDYRFYSEDMTHPSQQAVNYIRERFLDWALPEDEHVLLEENMRKFRRSQHRQMH